MITNGYKFILNIWVHIFIDINIGTKRTCIPRYLRNPDAKEYIYLWIQKMNSKGAKNRCKRCHKINAKRWKKWILMGIKSHLIQYVVIDWMDLCDVIKIKKHYRIKEKNSEIDSEQLFICSVFKCEAPRALFKIFILRNITGKKRHYSRQRIYQIWI